MGKFRRLKYQNNEKVIYYFPFCVVANIRFLIVTKDTESLFRNLLLAFCLLKDRKEGKDRYK